MDRPLFSNLVTIAWSISWGSRAQAARGLRLVWFGICSQPSQLDPDPGQQASLLGSIMTLYRRCS